MRTCLSGGARGLELLDLLASERLKCSPVNVVDELIRRVGVLYRMEKSARREMSMA